MFLLPWGESPSSSLWGCELKNWRKWLHRTLHGHPPCEDVSWKDQPVIKRKAASVILLVRMWVEKKIIPNWRCLWCHPPCEDVSWKFNTFIMRSFSFCHPPCEDVSWKTGGMSMNPYMSCHPPCEDVSWKIRNELITNETPCHPPCEDVSWKENDVKMYGTHV